MIRLVVAPPLATLTRAPLTKEYCVPLLAWVSVKPLSTSKAPLEPIDTPLNTAPPSPPSVPPLSTVPPDADPAFEPTATPPFETEAALSSPPLDTVPHPPHPCPAPLAVPPDSTRL